MTRITAILIIFFFFNDTATTEIYTLSLHDAHPIAVPSSVCLDYASSSSTSGFAETRLTTEGSNPYVQFANGAFIGDYSEIALGSDGVAHPVWTDFRGRPGVTAANQDIYTQSFRP